MSKRYVWLFGLGVFLVSFQNCSSPKGSPADESISASNTRTQSQGLPIGTFASGQSCDDGSMSEVIEVISQTDIELMESACQIQTPPVHLQPSEVTADPANATVIYYRYAPYLLYAQNKIAFVQEAESNSSNGVDVTFQGASGSGHLIVCSILYSTPNADTQLQLTDSAGNTYKSAVGPVSGLAQNDDWRVEIWYAENIRGGSQITTSASFTVDNNKQTTMVCLEYSGIATANALDAVGSNGDTVTGDIDVTTLPLSSPNEVIFAPVWSGTAKAGDGFTMRSQINGDIYMDKITTVVGPYDIYANVDFDWTGLAVSFRSQ